MMKKSLIALLSLLSVSAIANTDLVLEGERWLAQHKGYVCAAFTDYTNAPASHNNMNVKFEKLSTDYTLDNILIKATFENVDGIECSYSSILFADNAASTIDLVDSRAFSKVDASADCSEGKAVLDAQLANNDYLYWGHPHHATIMVPATGAAEVCGEGATHIGIDFMVYKRL
ncbi:hypothetical protein ABMA70_14035 [Halobacteriovorax sp. XZX-3]|uniref:hypothetical protein n=1 Tax=unclassified Halobacteriovorax TaxID=2639665 RepID=UPI003710C143